MVKSFSPRISRSRPESTYIQSWPSCTGSSAGGCAPTGVDPDLVRVQPARRAVAGQRPVGHVVMGVRSAPDAGVLRLGRAQQFVGADRQRGGESGEVVERESALTRLQPAQCRHVDARPAGDVLQRQPVLRAQFAQPPTDPDVDAVLRFCLHGKEAWHCGRRQASSVVMSKSEAQQSTGKSTTANVTASGAGGRTCAWSRWQRHCRRGRALDLGCGEGGDALWLAERGWHVVAVDISQTALDRAAADARARNVLDRIDFQRHDLSDTFPDGAFDLVSAQFLHSMVRLDRPRLLRMGAEAVSAGGTAAHRRPCRPTAVGVEAGPSPRVPQRRRGR